MINWFGQLTCANMYLFKYVLIELDTDLLNLTQLNVKFQISIMCIHLL